MPPTCLFNFAAAVFLQATYSFTAPQVTPNQTGTFRGPWHQITGLIATSFSRNRSHDRPQSKTSSPKTDAPTKLLSVNKDGSLEHHPHLKTIQIQVRLSLSRRSSRRCRRAAVAMRVLTPSVQKCFGRALSEAAERYTSAQMKGKVQRRRECGGRCRPSPR